jgi:hypothetical protein
MSVIAMFRQQPFHIPQTPRVSLTCPRIPPTIPRLHIGETISHYRIVEELGGGGMDVVYKDEDTLASSATRGGAVEFRRLPVTFNFGALSTRQSAPCHHLLILPYRHQSILFPDAGSMVEKYTLSISHWLGSIRQGLTANCRTQYAFTPLGVLVVKRSAWTFLLLVVTAVIFMSVVPMADNPETAFNEIDTPVNQTSPVSLWVKFAPPTRVPIILPRSFGRTGDGVRTSVESISLATHWQSSLLRELLCTLLI